MILDLIDNCIVMNTLTFCFQWARNQFQEIFSDPVEAAQQFINDPKFMERTLKMQGTQPVSCFISIVKIIT